MRADRLLHKTFTDASIILDKRISKAVFDSVDAIVNGACLSIASLGRFLSGKAKTKHKIKRIDRLFSNRSLQKSFTAFYKDIARNLLPQGSRPLILVDGSVISPCERFQFLSASIPLGGRSIPILECCFLREDIMAPDTHSSFLSQLNDILPDSCKPIIVTDGGFKNPWFAKVKQMGWDYIGRATSTVLFCDNDAQQWQPIHSLYDSAKAKPTFVGEAKVSKSSPMSHFIYSYKERAKGRVKKPHMVKKVKPKGIKNMLNEPSSLGFYLHP